ncbi:MAG: hypothetical protein M0P01_09410 [Treponema sp.]|nr:hypothetical protein [Treponema sp.]
MSEKQKRVKLFSIVWFTVAGLFLISWPLSHWFYYGLYTRFLGVSAGTYQDSLIKMIGTCGVLLSMCLAVIAKEPENSRLLMKMTSTFLVLLAATFVYLIEYKDFTRMEFLNAVFFVVIAVLLPVSYKWLDRK